MTTNTSTTLPSPPPVPMSGRTLRSRLRRLLVLGMNSLIVLLLLGVTLIMVLEQRQAISRLHTSTARYAGLTAQRALDDLRNTVVTAGQGLDPARATQDDLDYVLALNPALRAITLLDADGAVTAQTAIGAVDPGSAWRDHPARQAALNGQATIMTSVGGDLPLLVAAAPTGTGTGVIIALADPQTLWASTIAAPMGERGYLYLTDSAGQLLAAPPEQERDPALDVARLAIFDSAASGHPATRIYKGLAGSWVVGRAVSLADTPYLVFTETPLREFTSAAVRGLALWMMSVLMTLMLGEWLVRRMVQAIMGPLERLHQGARAVSQGDYGFRVRVPPHTDLELAELASAFNQMVLRLQHNQKEIASYKNQLEEIIELRARELSRKVFQLEVAADVSGKLAAIRDPRQLVETVSTLIRLQFAVYHVSVLLASEDSADGPPDIDLRADRNGMASWAVRHNAPIYIPDVNQDQRYRPHPDAPATQSALVIPLVANGQVMGALDLESEHRDAFQPDDRAVFEGLANEVAGALLNAYTFVKLEQANRDLAQTSLQARQANILKSRFLLTASHKLLAPLSALVGYAETTLSGVDGDLPVALLDRQRRILENGRALQALVEDMLDLSEVEAGQLQLDLKWLPLLPILDEIMNASRALHQAAHPDHTLVLRLDLAHRREALPSVWADPARLRYILMSLMSNAIKFADEGEVVLSADTTDNTVVINVRDTGPGILSEELAYLFEPFQKQRGVPGENQGTGLELAVSRLLAMRHGGDLRVTSVPGKGSTFTLILPRYPVGAPTG